MDYDDSGLTYHLAHSLAGPVSSLRDTLFSPPGVVMNAEAIAAYMATLPPAQRAVLGAEIRATAPLQQTP